MYIYLFVSPSLSPCLRSPSKPRFSISPLSPFPVHTRRYSKRPTAFARYLPPKSTLPPLPPSLSSRARPHPVPSSPPGIPRGDLPTALFKQRDTFPSTTSQFSPGRGPICLVFRVTCTQPRAFVSPPCATLLFHPPSRSLSLPLSSLPLSPLFIPSRSRRPDLSSLPSGSISTIPKKTIVARAVLLPARRNNSRFLH